MSMRDRIEYLIHEIEKHPILFDKSNADFKRSDMREEVWNVIAKRIGMTVSEAQTKWKNIKDYMVKHHKRSMTEGEQGSKHKPYKYAHLLGFLVQNLDCSYIVTRNADASDDEQENDLEFNESVSEHADDEDNKTNLREMRLNPPTHLYETRSNNETISTQTAPPPRKRPCFQVASEVGLTFMDNVTVKQEPTQNVEQFDDIDMFLKSMASSIRKLPAKARAQVLFSIHKTVHDAEMEYMYLEEKG